MTIAKLGLAKDVDDFAFKGTPIYESLVRDLAGGNFVAQQRNVVLVGGTGTGKTHLAIAIARSCICSGDGSPTFSPASTSSSSTSSAICPSPRSAGNCCSTP
jgi:DNA replication protein DnaC